MLNPEIQDLHDIADQFTGLDYQLPGVIPRHIYAVTLGRTIEATWVSTVEEGDVVTWEMLALSGGTVIRGSWQSDPHTAGYPAANVSIKAAPFPDLATVKPTEIRSPGYRHSNDNKYSCFYEILIGGGDMVTIPQRPARPEDHDRADQFVAALLERINR